MTIVLKFLPFPKRRILQPSRYRQYISKMNWGKCKLYLFWLMHTLNIWAANSDTTTLSTLVKVKSLIGCYYTIIPYFEVWILSTGWNIISFDWWGVDHLVFDIFTILYFVFANVVIKPGCKDWWPTFSFGVTIRHSKHLSLTYVRFPFILYIRR